MEPSPAALTLAWWGTALLNGSTSPDTFLEVLRAHGVRHVVGSTHEPGVDLLEALSRRRNHGVHAIAASFPTPGAPVGLRGPAALNAAAIEAGQVVRFLGGSEVQAWVPTQVGAAIEWAAYEAVPAPPLDLGEADRALRSALLRAADDLAHLDLVNWNADLADELIDLRRLPFARRAPGVPGRASDLAERAQRLLRAVDLAPEDGGAMSASEHFARREALERLAQAARLALSAAGSPDAWPPQ